MLFSKYREDRLVALSILTNNYLRGDEAIKEAVFDLYLNNTRLINNWDLVEASAPQIVGAFLWETDRSVLFELASSYDSWTWRITSIATFYFIKRGRFKETRKVIRHAAF
jgi:3-methyladenine DNA glycosylase AlkD